MAARRTIAFAWENIGPTHADRLDALGIDRELDVRAVEFSRRSSVYDWDAAEGTHFTIDTLFGVDETVSNTKLVWRLLRTCLGMGRVDFFFCHYERWPMLVVAWALRLCGRRVFTMIDSKFDDYTRRIWIELAKVVFLSPYRGALTASLRSREYMRFFGFRPERVALGYDTLSVDRIAALAEGEAPPEGTPFAQRDFIIVARLVPKKNIAMAIEAYRLWREQARQSRDLHICGSGPLESVLREQIEQAGIGAHVHFHGFAQSDAVARQLVKSLCLILPSIEEQFGLVVIEAQALGIPTLVSANAGASDMMVDPGINGFILNPKDPRACAALMLLLSEDESRWRQFASAAYEGRHRGDTRHFVAGVQRLLEL